MKTRSNPHLGSSLASSHSITKGGLATKWDAKKFTFHDFSLSCQSASVISEALPGLTKPLGPGDVTKRLVSALANGMSSERTAISVPNNTTDSPKMMLKDVK